jgi:hypothetical protein
MKSRKDTGMQFYWRIIEELRYLGETVTFRDPGLARQYHWWLRKNAAGLALSRETGNPAGISHGLRDLRRLVSLN